MEEVLKTASFPLTKHVWLGLRRYSPRVDVPPFKSHKCSPLPKDVYIDVTIKTTSNTDFKCCLYVSPFPPRNEKNYMKVRHDKMMKSIV